MPLHKNFFGLLCTLMGLAQGHWPLLGIVFFILLYVSLSIFITSLIDLDIVYEFGFNFD